MSVRRKVGRILGFTITDEGYRVAFEKLTKEGRITKKHIIAILILLLESEESGEDGVKSSELDKLGQETMEFLNEAINKVDKQNETIEALAKRVNKLELAKKAPVTRITQMPTKIPQKSTKKVNA